MARRFNSSRHARGDYVGGHRVYWHRISPRLETKKERPSSLDIPGTHAGLTVENIQLMWEQCELELPHTD